MYPWELVTATSTGSRAAAVPTRRRMTGIMYARHLMSHTTGVLFFAVLYRVSLFTIVPENVKTH
jgi:hypothetical protein